MTQLVVLQLSAPRDCGAHHWRLLPGLHQAEVARRECVCGATQVLLPEALLSSFRPGDWPELRRNAAPFMGPAGERH